MGKEIETKVAIKENDNSTFSLTTQTIETLTSIEETIKSKKRERAFDKVGMLLTHFLSLGISGLGVANIIGEFSGPKDVNILRIIGLAIIVACGVTVSTRNNVQHANNEKQIKKQLEELQKFK